AEAQNAARDLQNLPANVATPEFLSARARELEGVEVDVLGRDEIEARGMGALAAVSQGTYVEPQLIVLRYACGGSGPPLGPDAEGRLVLADALCYAVEEGAERLVDIATLTGAIVTALGHTYCGLFSDDDDWFAQVDAAGRVTGELGWRLPLHPEYEESTKGRYGDLQNVSESRDAGSIFGAEFLKRFTSGRPWVHMDIAGTAW